MLSYVVFGLKKYWLGILSLLVLLISFAVIAKSQHRILGRLDQFVEALLTYKPEDIDTIESTKIRLRVWESAITIIKDNVWIGVGNGDTKDELMSDYKKRALEYIYSSNLNAHNEFLQVFVGLGLIGFLILMANLLIPLFIAFKSTHWIYIFFLGIIIFNFMTESMLETQAGTMFYAFFNSLLCFEKRHESQT
jgi:O-antigen ligase